MSYGVAKITDHVAQALARLPSEHDAAVNLRAYISALVTQHQDLEDDAYDCIDLRQLSTAVGVQLDQYGKVVGEPRNGRVDADFRAAIRVRLQVNDAKGTINAVISAVSAALGGSVVTYFPKYPAALKIFFENVPAIGADLTQIVLDLMPQVVPAGVGWTVVEGSPDGDPSFRFDTPGAGYDEGLYSRTLGSE